MKKIVLLASISMFLVSVMLVTLVLAQPRVVGINVGDWFKYEEIGFDWYSNNPEATIPPYAADLNETEYVIITIQDISGTNVTLQLTTRFTNGTDDIESGYINIDTGDGNLTIWVISANLNVNDTLYTSGFYSTWRLNETIMRTYPDEVRDTTHFNLTVKHESNETGYYMYASTNYYWDRSSGIMVEMTQNQTVQMGGNYTTLSIWFRITESGVWVVPEFDTWTSMLIPVTILTVAILIHKRSLKTPTQR